MYKNRDLDYYEDIRDDILRKKLGIDEDITYEQGRCTDDNDALGAGDDEDKMQVYLRQELVDRGPDNLLFESDNQRDNSSNRSNVLNLRYNSTRGSTKNVASHPELFYGFMDRDPRGVENNPRLDEFKSYAYTRGKLQEIRMGTNDENHVTESIWLGSDINKSRHNIQDRLKGQYMNFTRQKDGRSTHSNIVADVYAREHQRELISHYADESLADKAYFIKSDHGYSEQDNTPRNFIALNPDISPWKNQITDLSLGIQKYNISRRFNPSQDNSAISHLTLNDTDMQLQYSAHNKSSKDLNKFKYNQNNQNNIVSDNDWNPSLINQNHNNTKFNILSTISHIVNEPQFYPQLSNFSRQQCKQGDLNKTTKNIASDQSLTSSTEGSIRSLGSQYPKNNIESIHITLPSNLVSENVIKSLKAFNSADLQKVANMVLSDGEQRYEKIMDMRNTQLVPANKYSKPFIYIDSTQPLEVQNYQTSINAINGAKNNCFKNVSSDSEWANLNIYNAKRNKQPKWKGSNKKHISCDNIFATSCDVPSSKQQLLQYDSFTGNKVSTDSQFNSSMNNFMQGQYDMSKWDPSAVDKIDADTRFKQSEESYIGNSYDVNKYDLSHSNNNIIASNNWQRQHENIDNKKGGMIQYGFADQSLTSMGDVSTFGNNLFRSERGYGAVKPKNLRNSIPDYIDKFNQN